MNTVEKITALRAQMQRHRLDAYIIPTADPHLSEYLPEYWQARAWFSGFTGSAGTLVITHDHAALWTDSRYWTQAAQQLSGSPIVLKKHGIDPHHFEWLREMLPEGARLGIPDDMISIAEQSAIQHHLSPRNITIEYTSAPIQHAWHNRPPLPHAPIFTHESPWHGAPTMEKLAQVRAAMREKHADAHLISSLDDIAWLTNLRGGDIAFNPVFLAHLLISESQCTLFIAREQSTPILQAALRSSNIDIQDIENIHNFIKNLSGSLWIESSKTAVSTVRDLPPNVRIIDSVLPSSLIKSQKTPHEIAHIREAMRQDGAALCGFFAELEDRLAHNITTTECDIDELLLKHRREQPHFVCASFDTIAGFNANGAMPHYRAEPETCSVIAGDGLLLIDSGAQYHNGTTDITRVIPIGTPNEAQKRDFTRVLKAHIALANAMFPENILSPMIDAIARQPLWREQCDFGHGTGHGVGYFLNVHEGPQRIAYQATPNPNQAMKIGMLSSNEPGLYRPEQYGIRIENLVVNQKVENPKETDFGTFLCFETLTLCPIDTRLVCANDLTADERDWLNTYHQRVRHELSPRVSGTAHDWLMRRTENI